MTAGAQCRQELDQPYIYPVDCVPAVGSAECDAHELIGLVATADSLG